MESRRKRLEAQGIDWKLAGTVVACTAEEGKTKQSFTDDSNINTLMRKYERTKQLPVVGGQMARYGDFSEIVDFHSAQNQIAEAKIAFNTLSARLRTRFGNDPGQLLQFLADPNNVKEGIEIGLYEKPEPPPKEPAKTVPSTPPEPPIVVPTGGE